MHPEYSTASVRPRKWLRRSLPIIFSIGGLVFLFYQLDAEALLAILGDLNLLYFSVSLLIAIIIQVIPAWRWKLLLNDKITLWYSCVATFVGNFISAVVPLRMGEIVKATLIRQKFAVPITEGLSSIIVTQVLDLLAIAFLGGVLLLLAPLPQTLIQAGIVMGVASVVMIMLFALVLYGSNTARSRTQQQIIRLFGEQRSQMLWKAYQGVIDGLQILKSPMQFTYATMLSVGFWLFTAFANSVMIVDLVEPSFVVVGGIAIAVAGGIGRFVPALPGSIGTLDAAVVLSLTTLGIDNEIAVAITLILRLRYTLMIAATGLIGVLGTGTNIFRLGQFKPEATS